MPYHIISLHITIAHKSISNITVWFLLKPHCDPLDALLLYHVTLKKTIRLLKRTHSISRSLSLSLSLYLPLPLSLSGVGFPVDMPVMLTYFEGNELKPVLADYPDYDHLMNHVAVQLDSNEFQLYRTPVVLTLQGEFEVGA
jgi:hypothetical protein